MKLYQIHEDIQLYTITACNFPEGILSAFEQLYLHVRKEDVETYYGLSQSSMNGDIIYKAAIKLKDTVTQPPKLETLILPAGDYLGTDILNFRTRIAEIKQTFQELITYQDIDKNGCCVEMYYNETDVRCMIRTNI